jgi:hypothetical protein
MSRKPFVVVAGSTGKPALRREFPDVAFHDFESWAKAEGTGVGHIAPRRVGRPRQSMKENQQ